MAKATNAEIEMRIATVLSLLMRGKTRAEIVRYGANKWELESRQIDEYLSRAKERLQEENKSTFEHDLALARGRISYLYDKAIGNEDYGLARVINQDFIGLTGVKAPDKLDVKMDVIEVIEPEFN